MLKNRLILNCIGLMLLFTIGGCAQPTLTQIAAFGTATESLSTKAVQGYGLIDEKVVKRKLVMLANDPNRGPKDKDFEGLIGAKTMAIAQTALATRFEALTQLGAYAGGLKKLATANFQEDIAAAALELNGALTGLELGKEERDLISVSINAIGRTIVEKKRREAIKTVIMQANPAIQDVAKLINSELGQKGGAGDAATQAVRTTEGVLKTVYNKNKSKPSSTFYKRMAQLEGINKLHQDARNTNAFFNAIGEAALQVGLTHGVLFEEVNKGNFSSGSIAISIGELMNQAKSVYGFYQSLQE